MSSDESVQQVKTDRATQLAAFIVGALVQQQVIPVDFDNSNSVDAYLSAIRIVAGALRSMGALPLHEDMLLLPFDW